MGLCWWRLYSWKIAIKLLRCKRRFNPNMGFRLHLWGRTSATTGWKAKAIFPRCGFFFFFPFYMWQSGEATQRHNFPFRLRPPILNSKKLAKTGPFFFGSLPLKKAGLIRREEEKHGALFCRLYFLFPQSPPFRPLLSSSNRPTDKTSPFKSEEEGKRKWHYVYVYSHFPLQSAFALQKLFRPWRAN